MDTRTSFRNAVQDAQAFNTDKVDRRPGFISSVGRMGKSQKRDVRALPAIDNARRGPVDAVARLMDRLDHVPVDVVGYSMGGRIALALAVRHPHHVASLSLIGASAGLSDAAERSARHHSDDDLADDLLEQGLEWFIDRWMASPLFASQVRLGTDALAAARAQRLENDPEGLAGSLRGAGAGSQPSYWHDLAGIDVPTLLVVGDEDPRFRAIAMRMAAGLPLSTISVVPGAGHAAHLENLDRTSTEILGFLAQLDEERRSGR